MKFKVSVHVSRLHFFKLAKINFFPGTRKDEIREIRKTAYCQSLGIIMAPTVPVISGIVTFVAHILSGGTLTASQVSHLIFLAISQHPTIFFIIP